MKGVRVQRCQPWLGTYVQIKAGARNETIAQSACNEAFKQIANIHHRMSFHDSQSEISIINREAHIHPVQVSSETWSVLDFAFRLSKISDGIFDISIVPLLQKWGYLPLTDQEDVSQTADYRDIDLLPNQFVSFRKPLRIDLGGIAKGFAVDKAVDVLKMNGVTDGIVNAGGDLRVFGGLDQIIQVRHPSCPGRLIPVAKIKEGAFATSADYYTTRFNERERVNPIVNPKTKTPSPSYQSVSVSASSCMAADALTKVVGLMGESCEPILKHYKARAIILKPGCKMNNSNQKYEKERFQERYLVSCHV